MVRKNPYMRFSDAKVDGGQFLIRVVGPKPPSSGGSLKILYKFYSSYQFAVANSKKELDHHKEVIA